MADIDNGKRVIDQIATTTINPDDSIIIDSATNGTREITYSDLCAAVAVTLGIAAIKSTADGAMTRSVYDADGDNIVDNAEKVNSHTVESDVPSGAVFTDTVYDDTDIKKEISDLSSATMKTIVYDTDGDGTVDNAKTVNGHSVSSDVPESAVFTDTTYTISDSGDTVSLTGSDGSSSSFDLSNSTTGKTVASLNEHKTQYYKGSDGYLHVTWNSEQEV